MTVIWTKLRKNLEAYLGHFQIWDDSFITFAKFPEKLTFSPKIWVKNPEKKGKKIGKSTLKSLISQTLIARHPVNS